MFIWWWSQFLSVQQKWTDSALQIVLGMPSADSLSVADGMLLKADEITIPAILIKEVMQKLHQGHLDIKNNWQERLCVLARPKPVTKQTWCPTCRSQSRQQKKPMIPVLAQQPWKRVSVDFYFIFFKGRNICMGPQFAMQYDFNYVTLPQSQKKGCK